MTASPQYALSTRAYLKLFLHASKYPHATILGLLLAPAKSGSSTIVIEDTIPLLHHWTTLSPMVEVGLELAKTYAATHGLRIAGTYVASENVNVTTAPQTAERIEGLLSAGGMGGVVLVIDNRKLGDATTHALIPYLPSRPSSTLSPSPPSSVALVEPTSTVVEQAREFVAQRRHLALGDFDEHLEDVAVDWLANRTVQVPS